MFKHMIDTGNFQLYLSLKIYENDIQRSSNTTMTITVVSDGFSAKTDMDIDIKEFAAFSAALLSIYDTLVGSASIKEPYGCQQYISFFAEKNGYITVQGYLSDAAANNELHFKNAFDQTHLKHFSQELASTYLKYSEIVT